MSLLSVNGRKGDAVPTFKKSQTVHALWQTLRNPAHMTAPAPALFIRRYDKLLSVNVPLNREERAGQAGYDNEMTAAQVFLMAVALVLMDSGLGLGTAGFFIHHARESLLKQYERIMLPQNRPSYLNEKDREDRTVWLLLQNRDLQELYPAYDRSKIEGWGGKGLPPLIINPQYAFGKNGRNLTLDAYISGGTHNHVLVVELARLASVLTHNLERAPVLRRGRPS